MLKLESAATDICLSNSRWKKAFPNGTGQDVSDAVARGVHQRVPQQPRPPQTPSVVAEPGVVPRRGKRPVANLKKNTVKNYSFSRE